MTDVVIADLTDIAFDFPEKIKVEIPRDALISTIEAIVDEGIPLVFIEGREGIGKTTLLAQFARSNSNRCFSLFLSGSNRYSYEVPSIRMNLLNQLHWFVNGEQLPEEYEAADDGVLREKIRKLVRKAQSKGERFYFIIDGMMETEDDKALIVEYIYDVLPIGAKGISVIVSGEQSILDSKSLKKVKHKSLPAFPFSHSETQTIFEEFKISKDDIRDIYELCRGHPGHLSSIKRLLESGKKWESLGPSLSQELPELFEIEWEAVNSRSEKLKFVLAFVAFSQSNVDLLELENLSGLEKKDLKEMLEGLSFLEIEKDDQTISFVSSSFKKFASEKLKSKESMVSNKIVEFLERKPDTEEALLRLPSYLASSGKSDKLLEFLDHSHFVRLIHHSKSMSTVLKQINVGLSVAGSGDRALPLSLAKSSLCRLSAIAGLGSEVAANSALGEKKQALYLAQTALLKEDRLQLLAAYLRSLNKQDASGVDIESVKDEIRNLAAKVDAEMVGEDRCIKIAADIFRYCPDVAVNLVERSVETKERVEEKDWALTRMTLTALVNSEGGLKHADAFNTIAAQIQHEKFKNVFNAAASFIESTNPTEIIGSIDEIGRTSDKLLLVRQWCRENKEIGSAIEIVKYAIDIALKDIEYTPSSSLYADLALVFKYSDDRNQVIDLIKIIDGQQSILFDRGPTLDYVNLQISLSESNRRDSFTDYKNRICNLFLDCVVRIEDPVQRLSATSALRAHLLSIDSDQDLEKSDGLHSLVSEELEIAVNEVLMATAEQFGAVEGALRRLAPVEIEKAVEIADRLNNLPRRNEGYFAIVEEISASENKIDWNVARDICKKIKDCAIKDRALIFLVRRYYEDLESLNELGPLLLYEEIKGIMLPSVRVEGLGIVYRSLAKRGGSGGLLGDITKEIDSALKEIDYPKTALESRFDLICEIAKEDPEAGRRYLEQTQKIRNESGAEIEMASSAIGYATSLAIRAFAGLLVSNSTDKNDLDVLRSAVNCFSSFRQLCFFWNLIICAYHLAGRTEECRSLFFSEIDPLLSNARKTNPIIYERTLVLVAPAFWLAHQDSASEYIRDMLWPNKDRALHAISQFLLQKKLPGDPLDNFGGSNYNLEYPDFLDLIKVMGLMDDDSSFHFTFKATVEALSKAKEKKKINIDQFLALKTNLEKLVEENLPKIGFISHEGYLISCIAELSGIKGISWPAWQALVDRAEEIVNISDKSFVLAIVASCIPGKFHKHRFDVLKRAKSIADTITSPADRLSRFQTIAEFAWEIDPKISTDCLKDGIYSKDLNTGDDIWEEKRKLIDLAYQIDPELPSRLISLLDDDPARNEVKKKLQNRSDFLKMRKEMSEDGKDISKIASKRLEELPNAAWKNLGLLNADRAVPLSMKQAQSLIPIAANLSLDRSYPIYAWIIQSLSVKYKDTVQAAEYLRPIFLAACSNARFVFSFVKSAKGDHNVRDLGVLDNPSDDEVFNVREGQRPEALNWIRRWLTDNEISHLTIADPFFGPDDLELIKLIESVNRMSVITVLTSQKHQKSKIGHDDWALAYKTKWRKELGDVKPPEVEIVILGLDGTGDSPIHDRWLIGETGGIRMGTSFNSLGLSKLSELSVLGEDAAKKKCGELDKYALRRVRSIGGKEINYYKFNL